MTDNTTSRTIEHQGKLYSLDDLAHYMDDAEREAIHGMDDTDTAQGYWDLFSARFPESADELVALVCEID